ncbi:hypothetical protein RSO41_13505 [Halomonas sp. I1]|uniref:hypothetical protein n=1 Tax=Halomonas sp. I1 TaxID=393536 RepID=UPI0028DE0FE2|nr:hypothetical protein [Halomonas sp. I1]MDT8895668.1 hypothetical protein [Halomonas sp. I1]
MSTYSDDSKHLQLQIAARQAAEDERLAAEQFERGVISEQQLVSAMDATEMAVKHAIRHGVSRRDLPAA